MKANALRLGNLVEYDNRIFKIFGITEELPFLNTDEFGVGVVDYNNIKPIPLTEEWLLKFGLYKFKPALNYTTRKWYIKTRAGVLTTRLPYLIQDKRTCKNSNEYEVRINPSGSAAARLCIIQYIHQLQNLYFTLTGEELNV